MKYDPTESYDTWVERVRVHETERAVRRISHGDNLEEVLEEMSKRVMEKIMHPLLLEIKNSTPVRDINSGRKEYEDNYIKKFDRKADHVSDE